MTSPTVQSFHHADTGTWSYLVADPATAQAAIIDPVLDFDIRSGRTGTASAQTLLDAARHAGLDLRWLLETHAHADHLSATQWLKAQLCQTSQSPQVAIGRGIVAVQSHFVPLFGLQDEVACDGRQFDRLLDDDAQVSMGELDVQAIAVPGHTPDSLAYLIGDALFTGDTLFMPDAGSARCDFPGGDAATLYRSVQRLYALPDSTRVFVCHDYGPNGRRVACETSIAAQKRDNIHLREDVDEAQFVALRQARDATLAVPALLLPALQVNLRGGALPAADDNGVRSLILPLDRI